MMEKLYVDYCNMAKDIEVGNIVSTWETLVENKNWAIKWLMSFAGFQGRWNPGYFNQFTASEFKKCFKWT